MLLYKVVARTNPINKKETFHPALVSPQPVDINRIADDIEKISSLSRGDIKNVLDNLQHVVTSHLADGHSVRLGNIGSFRLSLRSSGVDSKEAVSPACIRSVCAVFTPSSEMKRALRPAALKFEKVSAPQKNKAAPTGG